ncbi:MAG: hypothetical protein IT559_02120 [Alphaproteobacteria bacterium]|nr:hypothetical protein [Alphaproteobacteria bacterium]
MSYARTLQKLSHTLTPIWGGEKRPDILNKSNLEKALALQGDVGEAKEIALPFTKKIAKKLGLNPDEAVVDGPIKKLPRIFEKAAKLDGQVEKVPDIARLRILIKKPEDIINLRKMLLGDKPKYEGEGDRMGVLLNKHPQNNIIVNEFEDYFHVPSSTGRVAVHIGLKVPLSSTRSIPVEIQVIHEDMLGTEDLTHDNYEKSCQIERRAKEEGRPQTPQEAEAISLYRQSNESLYTADCFAYDLMKLRRPDKRKKIVPNLYAVPQHEYAVA